MSSPHVLSRSQSPVPPSPPSNHPANPLLFDPPLSAAAISDRAQLMYLKTEANILRAQMQRLQELLEENQSKQVDIVMANWEPTMD
jgi:hypothetical protein